MNMNTTDKQLLIEGHLLGCLSADESAELEALLLNDRALRDDFRKAAALDAALREAACPELVEAACSALPEQKPLPVRSRSRFWAVLTRAAAVLMLILSAVTGWYGIHRLRHPTVATLTNVSGEVLVRFGTSMDRAQLGRRLWSGMDIETGGDRSSAIITWTDGSTMRLDHNTRLNISILDGRKRAALAAGMLSCEVVKQAPGKPMFVSTPRSHMEVLGTVFRVTATPDVATTEVVKGRVKTGNIAQGPTVALEMRQKMSFDASPEFEIEEFYWSDRYRSAVAESQRRSSHLLQQTEGLEIEAKRINSRFLGGGGSGGRGQVSESGQ